MRRLARKVGSLLKKTILGAVLAAVVALVLLVLDVAFFGGDERSRTAR